MSEGERIAKLCDYNIKRIANINKSVKLSIIIAAVKAAVRMNFNPEHQADAKYLYVTSVKLYRNR